MGQRDPPGIDSAVRTRGYTAVGRISAAHEPDCRTADRLEAAYVGCSTMAGSRPPLSCQSNEQSRNRHGRFPLVIVGRVLQLISTTSVPPDEPAACSQDQ